jgi:hypothetical protein
VSIKHDIGVGLGEPVQLRAVRMHILAARFPGSGMDQKQALAVQFQVPFVWLRCEKREHIRVDSVTLSCSDAGGRQKYLLVVPLDDVRAAFLEPRHDSIRKLIFKDAVAKAKEFIDITHGPQSEIQALKITMQVRNDTDFQSNFLEPKPFQIRSDRALPLSFRPE